MVGTSSQYNRSAAELCSQLISDPLAPPGFRNMAQSLAIALPSDPAGNGNAKPIQIPRRDAQSSLTSSGPSQGAGLSLRTGHLNLDTFSPVNEHGSFEFDRVLKRGKVICKIKSRHVRVILLWR